MRRVADTGPGALTSSRRPVEHLAAVAELPRKCPHRLLPSPTIGAEQSAGWHAATQGRGSAIGYRTGFHPFAWESQPTQQTLAGSQFIVTVELTGFCGRIPAV